MQIQLDYIVMIMLEFVKWLFRLGAYASKEEPKTLGVAATTTEYPSDAHLAAYPKEMQAHLKAKGARDLEKYHKPHK